MGFNDWVTVGTRIRPADGSSYRGVILEIVENVNGVKVSVRHQREDGTGEIWEKSWEGFPVRYSPTETWKDEA